MNRLQFLSFLILCPILAHSQTTISKGVDRIVVEDSLLMEQNYQLSVKTLLDNGFEIDKTDKGLGTVTTVPQVEIPTPLTTFFRAHVTTIS